MNATVTLRVLLAACLLLPFALAHAQQGRLHSSYLQVLSAVTDGEVIADAEVITQVPGAASERVYTDSRGIARIPTSALSAGDDATLIIRRAGYSNLVAHCPCGGLTYAMSPILTELEDVRIVLQWGSEPADLDAHLFSSGGHINYANPRGQHAQLDIDQQDGYGPETITIHNRRHGVRYLYGVHNYSATSRPESTSLAASNARVNVYVGSTLIRTFTLAPNRTGNTWWVFMIGEDGEFYDLGLTLNLDSLEAIGSAMERYIDQASLASMPTIERAQQMRADAANRQGETAYQAGDLEEAERHFLRAIDYYPDHAQAYSNLGVLYMRLEKSAEGLFVNRKAIALASGANAATIKASSHFNIARIYEANAAWEDALRHYQEALDLREHRAYTNGIERMRARLSGE
ncbi:hypothetical protein CAI21_01875 [Alkalilimnicola ehrlichii]|uniref:Uncharacterized protein n=1 Tax=Alkalilimnicola ehrlichii TaxID=351052 RepID=A0A3E0X1H4_9GAMM|nr:tetratricopeptide repeat protein [Alkalilimnicola ehrlichii]RFA31390.1 hypothetical protein CAI21_01875 [Alkalilimnicola ehrlichii]RFA39337.1 hypothetical protein CAL65_00525 [Alkalilimnicola ehrlichii]